MNQTLFFRLLNIPLFLGLGLCATTILMHPAASRARPVDAHALTENESETAPLAEQSTQEDQPEAQQPASPTELSADDQESQLAETDQSERPDDGSQPHVTITTAPRGVVLPHQTSTSNLVTKSKPEKIVIVNTSDTYPVAFLLNDEVRKLEPKESLELEDTAALHFDRGGSFGTSSRDLTVGRYEFELTPGGWALFGLDE